MRLILRLAIPLMAMIASGVSASAAQKVTDFTLPNGMQVVLIEDHRAPVVNHMIWYRVGSADDPRGHSGIAHFFEHLMFKATRNLADGAFSKVVAANGGTDNAFTSFDYTSYYQRIAADRLGLVMDMEADRMRNLVLSREVVETERAVILEERNQRTEVNPQALFNEQMDAALFLNSPYGIPPIGWRHEIEALSLEDARTFYDRYYAPDNAIAVIAGDVTPEQVRALAEQYYGLLKPSGRPPDARPQEPPHLAARRLVMHDARVRQSYVMRTYLAASYDPDNPVEAAALSLLSDILGGGITSRLAKSLQLESKVAIDTGTFFSAMSRDPARFALYGVKGPDHDLAAVEAAIDVVIAEMIASGPTDEEVARIKRLKRANLIYAQDDAFGVARNYGGVLAAGYSVADVQNWPDVLQSVTAEDIRSAAAKFLVIERSVTGWLMGAKEPG
jgi:zinc protease